MISWLGQRFFVPEEFFRVFFVLVMDNCDGEASNVGRNDHQTAWGFCKVVTMVAEWSSGGEMPSFVHHLLLSISVRV